MDGGGVILCLLFRVFVGAAATAWDRVAQNLPESHLHRVYRLGVTAWDRVQVSLAG